jgi:phosphopantothenoylcysteine decarboxylase/phosphopantothenate--cysteine ligase
MKILVSAGPTRENIDPVRYISNRSSGKMGYALAEAAAKLGHKVVLVSGPVSIRAPGNVELVNVDTAAEMAREIRRRSRGSDIIIMAAAVADYAPVRAATKKIKKTAAGMTLRLKRTEDILAWLGKNRRKNQIVVGFSAETDNLITNALSKLKRKKADWIIANEVGVRKDRGFESDSNQATMISKNGKVIELPLQSKNSLAKKILGVILPQPLSF